MIIKTAPHPPGAPTSAESQSPLPEDKNSSGPAPWYELPEDVYQNIHTRLPLPERLTLGRVDKSQFNTSQELFKRSLLEGLKRIKLGPKHGPPWTMTTIPEVRQAMLHFSGELNPEELAIVEAGLKSDHLALKEVDVAHFIKRLKIDKEVKADLAASAVRALWEPDCREILAQCGVDPSYLHNLSAMREAVLKSPSWAVAQRSGQFRGPQGQTLRGPRTIGSTPSQWVQHKSMEGVSTTRHFRLIQGGYFAISRPEPGNKGLIFEEDPSGEWRVVHELVGHPDWITAAAQLPDGRLATGSLDGTLRVWSQTDNRWNSVLLPGHPVKIWACVAAPNGQIVSAGHDGARVWSENDGVWSCDFLNTNHPVNHVEVLADGKIVTRARKDDWNGNPLKIWVKNGDVWMCEATLPDFWIRACPKGGFFGSDRWKKLGIWRCERGWRKESISDVGFWPPDPLLLPDGRVASFGKRGEILISKKKGQDCWVSTIMEVPPARHYWWLGVALDGRLMATNDNRTTICSEVGVEQHLDQTIQGYWFSDQTYLLPDGRLITEEDGNKLIIHSTPRTDDASA